MRAVAHLVEIWTLWTPVYWFAGSVKVLTAVASVATAIALPPLIPKSLELIRTAKLSEWRQQQLQWANTDLEHQIGGRKRIEEELSKSEERFRSLVQNLQVGVTLSGPRGEALMCNPAAWRLLGITENQFASSVGREWQVSYEDEEVFPSLAPAQQISRVIASRQPVRDAMLSVERPDQGDVV